MKWLTQVVALVVLLALGTWFGGWWMVPVLAALYGAWGARQRHTILTALLAGVTAWAVLLLLTAALGPMDRLLQVLGAFKIPGIALVVLTLAYAGLLAATAAAVARGLRRLATADDPA